MSLGENKRSISASGTEDDDTQPNTLRELYNRAVQLTEEGDVESAQALLYSVATSDEDDDVEACRSARCYLGVLAFENGDYDTAVSHFRIAAQEGDDLAAVNLAVCIQRGVGVEMNENAAFQMFAATGAKGSAVALLNAGKCFLLGRGTVKDEVKALRAFERAARLGEPYANYNLALAAELGISMNRDLAKAYHLYELAAENGVKDAVDDAYRVRRELNGIFDTDT